MRCGCRRAGARRATGQRGLNEQRTTSKMGMKTTRRMLTYVGNKASCRHTTIGQRNQGSGLSLGIRQGTSGVCAEFSPPRAFAEAEPQSHLRDPISEKSRNISLYVLTNRSKRVVKVLEVVRR